MSRLQKTNYELKISDAYQLVANNILINKMSLENLQLQQEYTNIQIELHNMTINIAKKKIEFINQLNLILEKQLNEYCEVRQDECKIIYDDINALDVIDDDFKEKANRISVIHNKMAILMEKIDKIRASIPSEITINNYRIRPNKTEIFNDPDM